MCFDCVSFVFDCVLIVIDISEPPHPPRMRGVVVRAALVLAILAPALALAEEEDLSLSDTDPETKPQRGDMAGDHEVS